MIDFLYGPLITAGLAAGLALVIVVLDAIVNNYGDVKIDINEGQRSYTVRGGANLLGTMAAEGVFVPSACGGRGSCGACKVRVLSDVGPHLPTELPYLSAEEVTQNVRLACQIKLKKDIAIELAEELFSVKKFQSTVSSIKTITHDIKEAVFRLDNPGEIEFMAGQYVQLVVPPYGTFKESVQRAYSMSSKPGDRQAVELLIRLVPGGIATTWVHQFLKEGDRVELVGPFGEFHVRDTTAAMVCVAGGSGMAPFKSMFYDILQNSSYPEKEIWYFFGARSGRDMFYLDELRQLETLLPRFHFVPALSEPSSDDKWTGETGLITDVLERFLKERIGTAKGLEGYLCGSPGMINACTTVMTRNGINLEKIYYDKFA
ncbi:MAG: oxidoreductase [Spirochaetes bacterium GWD1_61_31]|nr:MAG: oxidoreductase [Spirochaetes bacterium GWB1_60_80]OHD34286.1 MAG: oxidoreductase [Spirochaetes bacterium GWC1_61_12]OHD40214.1 MAG: oxidoreductase [Spirochaetes bacterium GWD1_61_31]OHD45738.1 MAG: oxidoreductase [Spirochaetes bacterium GWE1_60_18]OHD58283.1 MAG: oxidoreductase [Spirochaetes bacterium GWF1_60_12]